MAESTELASPDLQNQENQGLHCKVLIGAELFSFVKGAQSLEKRDSYNELMPISSVHNGLSLCRASDEIDNSDYAARSPSKT
ncbi:MAG: hypothetical protein LBT59_04175 [Clostridiales bacterium]|jgi:hypothetical protein|nr:hypothetical protein [Clostridiales bacterium]